MKLIIYLLAALFLASCVEQPNDNNNPTKPDAGFNGVFILCEGLKGQGNASLARYDLESEVFTKNFYQAANPGIKLGDTANDIEIKGDTAYIVVTISKTIEMIRVSDGASLKRLTFEESRMPHDICFANDSLAFISDWLNACVIAINPLTLEIINDNIPVGPAPEDIVYYQGRIFVANSGAGDILFEQPGAWTVSVIDVNSFSEITRLKNLPNVTELEINEKNNKLYAGYLHLPSKEDSLGGIVEFDLNTLERQREWRDEISNIILSPGGDSLLYISDKGVQYIDLALDSPTPMTILENPDKDDIWYSIGISMEDGSLWVANAFNNQINGEVSVYDNSSIPNMMNVYNLGVNPGKIIFY